MMMSSRIIFRGRMISEGIAEGTAIVTREGLCFLGGVDPETGVIKERKHELFGESIAGKIFIFPSHEGSAGGMWIFRRLAKAGKAPLAIIAIKADAVLAAATIYADIPCVDKLDKDPVSTIATGDKVKVISKEGRGIVEVEHKELFSP